MKRGKSAEAAREQSRRPLTTCPVCGGKYIKAARYQRSCGPCYKQANGYDFYRADVDVMALQREVKTLEIALQREQLRRATSSSGSSLTRGDIMKMIALCHPDKHGNSEIATEVTRKLLDLRNKSNG